MARAAARLYVPLDANFFDDDRIVQAGEAAGWLYLAMCAKAKQLDTDGVLSRAQVERLGIKGWQRRLALLQATTPEPLVVQVDDRYGISGWLNWNESSAARAERLAADRARKRGGGKP